MKMYALSEKLLETQICSVCKQYLSRGPIKVYSEAGPRCGRCSSKNDKGGKSFIEKIVSHAIFPCINRFEGCNRLLKFQDVPEHEKTCMGQQYQCPLCPEDKYLPNSLLYLVNHYKIFHNRYYLTEPSFFVDVSSCKDYFYLYCDKSENILLVIFVQVKGRNKLCINASTVGAGVDKIKYKVKFYVNGSEKYVSEERACPAVGQNFELMEINFNTILKSSSLIILGILELNLVETLNISLLSNKLEDSIQESVSKPIFNEFKEKVEEQKRIIKKQERKNTVPEDYGNVVNLKPSLLSYKLEDSIQESVSKPIFNEFKKKVEQKVIIKKQERKNAVPEDYGNVVNLKPSFLSNKLEDSIQESVSKLTFNELEEKVKEQERLERRIIKKQERKNTVPEDYGNVVNVKPSFLNEISDTRLVSSFIWN